MTSDIAALAEAFQGGDARAGDEIARTQQGLVGAVVKRYIRVYQGERDDLVQAGFIGLTRAAKHYDRARGAWSSFAWLWIKKYCLEEVARQGRHAGRNHVALTEDQRSDEDQHSPLEGLSAGGDAVRLNEALSRLPLASEARLRCRFEVAHCGPLILTDGVTPALCRRESAALISALRRQIR